MSSNAYITLTEGGIHKLVKASDLVAESVDAAIVSKLASGVPEAKVEGKLQLSDSGLLRYVATGTPRIEYSTDGGTSWQTVGAASGDSGTVTVAWSDITGEVSGSTALQTALNGKSDVGHVHTISAITALQSTLDNKAASVHQHDIADVTSLDTTLAGKANSTHYHAIADVTGLETQLANKAASIHTHAQNDITGLADTLAGKAASTHTHAISDVTQLDTKLSSKADASAVTTLQTSLQAHTSDSTLHLPTTAATVGQVLTKTEDGATWQDIQASGDGSAYVLPTASATTLGGIKVGTGLSIHEGVLSTTGTGTASSTWGQITGTLADQADLQEALDAKASTNALTEVQTTAQAASNTALQASDAAASAKSTANEAKTTADAASSTASAASSTAADANANATTALNTANTANANATTAVTTANSATTTANSAVTLINTHSGSTAIHVPQDGAAGQVLTKTDAGSAWSTLSMPDTYTLPIATASSLGGIRIGSNLTIDPDTGVLSATLQTDDSGAITITAVDPLQLDASTNTLSIGAYPAMSLEDVSSTAAVSDTEVSFQLVPGHCYIYENSSQQFSKLVLGLASGYDTKAGECFLWVLMSNTGYIEGPRMLDTPFPGEYNLLHIAIRGGHMHARVLCHAAGTLSSGTSITYGSLRVLYPSQIIPDGAQWTVGTSIQALDDSTTWYDFGDIVTLPIEGKPLVIQLKTISGYTPPAYTYTGLCQDKLNTVICGAYTETTTE